LEDLERNPFKDLEKMRNEKDCDLGFPTKGRMKSMKYLLIISRKKFDFYIESRALKCLVSLKNI